MPEVGGATCPDTAHLMSAGTGSHNNRKNRHVWLQGMKMEMKKTLCDHISHIQEVGGKGGVGGAAGGRLFLGTES